MCLSSFVALELLFRYICVHISQLMTTCTARLECWDVEVNTPLIPPVRRCR